MLVHYTCRPDAHRATARVIECPTFYVEYRGWSQEVNTLHLETVNGDEDRFSAEFRHTPLDQKPSTVKGHSPADVIAKVREAIESARWDVHYRQIIDRLNAAEAPTAGVTTLPPPSASPADAPSPLAAT